MVNDRKLNTVFIALAFRLSALVYEIIMLIVLIIYILPMTLSQKIRNKWIDHFMIELKSYTNGRKN